MPPHFLILSDDQHKAFINLDSIAMFRVRKADNYKIADPLDLDIEVEFVGGTKTKLHGDPAKHFLSAINKAYV